MFDFKNKSNDEKLIKTNILTRSDINSQFLTNRPSSIDSMTSKMTAPKMYSFIVNYENAIVSLIPSTSVKITSFMLIFVEMRRKVLPNMGHIYKIWNKDGL